MGNKTEKHDIKSTGLLLQGMGVLFIGIAALVFALRGCSRNEATHTQPPVSEEDFQELVENAKTALKDPEVQKLMERNIKKAFENVEVKEVKTKTTNP